jgi:antagonist of KipI
MRYGIPPSGAMDQYSYHIGNLLLGNPERSASLEVTLQGLIIESTLSVEIAITGGDLNPYLNGSPVPLWVPFIMKRRDVLHFKQRKDGLRAYLAVRGGFDVPEFLGSKSTFVRGKIGTTLKEGDILSIGHFDETKCIKATILPKEFIPVFGHGNPVRVLIGPQNEYFTRKGIETFLTSAYRLSSKSDRQACRTEGPAIEISKGPGIITDPTPLGAIQVPGDGKPIILLRDSQVTGGYAKIATVVSVDLDRLGQIMPGEVIRFKQIDRKEAITLLFEKRKRLNDLKFFCLTSR